MGALVVGIPNDAKALTVHNVGETKLYEGLSVTFNMPVTGPNAITGFDGFNGTLECGGNINAYKYNGSSGLAGFSSSDSLDCYSDGALVGSYDAENFIITMSEVSYSVLTMEGVLNTPEFGETNVDVTSYLIGGTTGSAEDITLSKTFETSGSIANTTEWSSPGVIDGGGGVGNVYTGTGFTAPNNGGGGEPTTPVPLPAGGASLLAGLAALYAVRRGRSQGRAASLNGRSLG